MALKRSLILAAVLAAGMSSIYVLPPFHVTESAMNLEIPKEVGDWTTTSQVPSEKEITSLASDTVFSKATCTLLRSRDSLFGGLIEDRAELSIVLSGQDLANSIHRPERCMEAQGHKVYASEKSDIEVPNLGMVPTRRLLSKQNITAGKVGERIEVELKMLTYYFFVGNETITESHKTRTLVDMRDRLKKGQAQKWAYVLVSMPFKDGSEDPRFNWEAMPDLKIADAEVRSLLEEISESNINWKQVTALN
ncbi:exosortase-associated EpsI family protein [Luteolibacter sp. Populi]|uniref:exosortase-associated EpsI family protein n=1 Tax=Luteolibacter sp. Populi TaxID=3230487 RepID=UPI0034670436